MHRVVILRYFPSFCLSPYKDGQHPICLIHFLISLTNLQKKNLSLSLSLLIQKEEILFPILKDRMILSPPVSCVHVRSPTEEFLCKPTTKIAHFVNRISN